MAVSRMMVICNLWMDIRLLWYIVIKYDFLEYQCLSPFEKFMKLAREENIIPELLFCVHSLIQPIYTIQSKIERMLFKSLCLLSPYMHHFISSIIITVLCVPKITCPCFPILGCIKNKNLQVQTITYYLPIEIKTIPIHVDALRKILKTFRMAGIYIWNYWKFSIAILGFIPSFRNIYSAFLFFQFPFS